MSLISLEFGALFAIFILLYFIVPRKMQIALLFAFSVFFSIASDGALFLFMLFTIVSTYAGAKLMMRQNAALSVQLADISDELRDARRAARDDAERYNKRVLHIVLFANFCLWAVIKYTNFSIETINMITGASFPLQHFVMPLGMSFYTFQSMGYLTDVYRHKYEAESTFIKVATFITFFPHIVQGPFSRFDQLGKTLFRENKFSYDNLCKGSRRILWGLVKKLLIADKLGLAVNVYFLDVQGYKGAYLWVASVLYGMQLYADFSGYMDMVCGGAKIMGIEVAENFERPFLAKSVEEYWRRWHITLGTWFRDYVFYPISMGPSAQKLGRKSRKKFGPRMGKLVPSYLALIFVWSITGIWHGAAWKYVIWGLANLFIIVFSMQMETVYKKCRKACRADSHPHIWGFFQVFRTFWLINFLRVMSNCKDFMESITYYGNLFRGWGTMHIEGISSFFPSMSRSDIIIASFFSLIFVFVDLMQEYNKWDKFTEKVPGAVRSITYAGLIFALFMYAGGNNDLTSGFLYAVF